VIHENGVDTRTLPPDEIWDKALARGYAAGQREFSPKWYSVGIGIGCVCGVIGSNLPRLLGWW